MFILQLIVKCILLPSQQFHYGIPCQIIVISPDLNTFKQNILNTNIFNWLISYLATYTYTTLHTHVHITLTDVSKKNVFFSTSFVPPYQIVVVTQW